MEIDFMEEVLEKKEEIEKLKIKRILLNEKQTEEYNLKNAVSDNFFNLNIFYVLYDDCEKIVITEEVLKDKGLEKKDVREIAERSADSRANTLENVIKSIYMSLNFDQVEFAKKDELYKLPNDYAYILADVKPYFGAGVILDTDFLRSLSDKLNGNNLCILPSSVHEVIVMPIPENVDYNTFVEQCKEMVESVNETLKPIDVLSDDIYIYNYCANNISLYI